MYDEVRISGIPNNGGRFRTRVGMQRARGIDSDFAASLRFT